MIAAWAKFGILFQNLRQSYRIPLIASFIKQGLDQYIEFHSVILITMCSHWFVFTWLDSPAIPPSAGAHQLFRGFSYIDPTLLEEATKEAESNNSHQSPKEQVCISFHGIHSNQEVITKILYHRIHVFIGTKFYQLLERKQAIRA